MVGHLIGQKLIENIRNQYLYILKSAQKKCIGIIQLVKDDGMLIMKLIELSPFNLGSENSMEM